MGHTEVHDIPRAPYYTTGGPFLPKWPKNWARNSIVILGTASVLMAYFTYTITREPYMKVYVAPYASRVTELRKNGRPEDQHH